MNWMATRKISAHDTFMWHYLCSVYACLVTPSVVCNRFLRDLPQVLIGAKPQWDPDIYRVLHVTPVYNSVWVTEVLVCWTKKSAPLKPTVCPATSSYQTLRATKNLSTEDKVLMLRSQPFCEAVPLRTGAFNSPGLLNFIILGTAGVGGFGFPSIFRGTKIKVKVPDGKVILFLYL